MTELVTNSCWCFLSMQQSVIGSKWWGHREVQIHNFVTDAESGVCVKVTGTSKTRRQQGWTGNFQAEPKCPSASAAQAHHSVKNHQFLLVFALDIYLPFCPALCAAQRGCRMSVWLPVSEIDSINPHNVLQTLLLLALVVEDQDISTLVLWLFKSRS